MVDTFYFEGLTIVIEIVVSDILITPRVTTRSGRTDQHIEISVRDKLIDTRITAHSCRAGQHIWRQCVIYNNFYRSHDDDDVIVLISRTVAAGDVIWQRGHCQHLCETLGLPEPARTTADLPSSDVRTRSKRYFDSYSYIVQCT